MNQAVAHTTGERTRRTLRWIEVGLLALLVCVRIHAPQRAEAAVSAAGLAQQLVVNGGFEGDGGWTMPTTPRTATLSSAVVRSGAWAAAIGCLGEPICSAPAYSSLRQTVTIPAGASSATLSFSLYPVAEAGAADDAQYVRLLDPDSGAVLKTLLWTLSDAQAWQRETFDLSAYAGRSVVLHFGVSNDGAGGQAGMYVDDVSLTASSFAASVFLPLTQRAASNGPRIEAFTATPMEVLPGESLTLEWSVAGATDVLIKSYHPGYVYAPWISGGPVGSETVTIGTGERYYRLFVLAATDSQGRTTTRSIKVTLTCPYPFFCQAQQQEVDWSCPVIQCPGDRPIATAAAEQVFEGGRMVWLQDPELGDDILVLLDEPLHASTHWRFSDDWEEGMPEDDPDIVPPEGLYQPRRGFGKVWRENDEIRDALGWALAPEQGYEAVYQHGWRSYYGTAGAAWYLSLSDGEVAYLYPYQWAPCWQTSPSGGPEIDAFTATPTEVLPGESVLLEWSTTGAVEAEIQTWLRRMRLSRGPSWSVDPVSSEMVTVPEVERTWIRYTLVVTDSRGQTARESVYVDITCPDIPWFFDPLIQDGTWTCWQPGCPGNAAQSTWAAEQAFEGGRMVWLADEDRIYVIFDEIDTRFGYPPFDSYADDWEEGMPVDDPDIVPPEGFYQPQRGFGKVWRENADVREELGWALAPEEGYEAAHQRNPLYSGVTGTADWYLELADGEVLKMHTVDGWLWESCTQ